NHFPTPCVTCSPSTGIGVRTARATGPAWASRSCGDPAHRHERPALTFRGRENTYLEPRPPITVAGEFAQHHGSWAIRSRADIARFMCREATVCARLGDWGWPSQAAAGPIPVSAPFALL